MCVCACVQFCEEIDWFLLHICLCWCNVAVDCFSEFDIASFRVTLFDSNPLLHFSVESSITFTRYSLLVM